MNERAYIGALQACSLHALLLLTSRALALSGFGDVQVLDRRHSKQKSRYGGHELVCHATFGILPVKVIVKVINDSVRLRMLDESAGAVMRTNADFGLIVSPHCLTRTSRKERDRYRQSRVAIMEGVDLAAILRKHKVGVREKGDVDYAFFESLEEACRRILDFMERMGNV